MIVPRDPRSAPVPPVIGSVGVGLLACTVPAKERRPSALIPDPLQRMSASPLASAFSTTQVDEKRPTVRPATSFVNPVALSTWPGFRPSGPDCPACRMTESRTNVRGDDVADHALAAETAASTISVTPMRRATMRPNLSSRHSLVQGGGREIDLRL